MDILETAYSFTSKFHKASVERNRLIGSQLMELRNGPFPHNSYRAAKDEILVIGLHVEHFRLNVADWILKRLDVALESRKEPIQNTLVPDTLVEVNPPTQVL